MAATKRKRATRNSKSDRKKKDAPKKTGGLTHSFDAARGLAEEIPIYKDGLQKPLREASACLATSVAFLTSFVQAFAGRAAWGQPVIAGFKARMREKVDRIPEEQLKQPQARIAGPLLNHYLFVAGDVDHELRDLFEGLLSSSMRKDRFAHPSFVEMLKQMSSDDARLVRHLPGLLRKYQSESFAYIRARAAKPDEQGFMTAGFLCDLDFVDGLDQPDHLATCVSNLVRLGIVEVDMGIQKAAGVLYEELEQSSAAEEIRNFAATVPGRSVEWERGVMRLTSIGHAFLEACEVQASKEPIRITPANKKLLPQKSE